MGTECYLIKPVKKEIFYLGKHFHCLEGINDATYQKEAFYPDYECFSEFLMDYIDENHWEFDDELTWGRIVNEAHSIYEWCNDDKVLFTNDCAVDVEDWINWKETGSILNAKEEE